MASLELPSKISARILVPKGKKLEELIDPFTFEWRNMGKELEKTHYYARGRFTERTNGK